MIRRFIFPKRCVNCKKVIFGKGIFCFECMTCIDFLDNHNRCRRCFSEKTKGECLNCLSEYHSYYKLSAVFDKDSPAQSLLCDTEKFAIIIASCFIFQFIKFNWPIPAFIYYSDEMKSVGKKVSNVLNTGKFPKNNDLVGENLLYISSHKENINNISHCSNIFTMRIFFIVFSF